MSKEELEEYFGEEVSGLRELDSIADVSLGADEASDSPLDDNALVNAMSGISLVSALTVCEMWDGWLRGESVFKRYF